MAVKYYGKLSFNADNNTWLLSEVPPHVCITLKSLFPKIRKHAVPPFPFDHNTQNCLDLLWFMDRYPMQISGKDLAMLKKKKKEHNSLLEQTEKIFDPNYSPTQAKLNENERARDYQLKARDFHSLVRRCLIGDDIGLGKTLTSILSLLEPGRLPAAVVVQTHLPAQWKEQIERFTNLKVHVIKNTTPYTLSGADVYIFKYSQLSGWCNYFNDGFFTSVIFDEVQELRRVESNKYMGAKVLAMQASYCMGLSATPVINYGSEVYNILDLIKPNCLGFRDDFLREWTVPRGNHYVVKDPNAFGAYLRDSHLFLRRTRQDVGRELPAINKIIHTVGVDQEAITSSEELARSLAMKVLSADEFVERGQAARQLDMLMRQVTGVSKAKYVAQYVRMLLENNIPVLLAGWHREVYDIWLSELKDFNPVLYTGSESTAEKQKSKQAFVSGETNLMIISLRSGVGLDGLQERCSTVVIGELDWSPQVHAQLIGRVDRDGALSQTTAIFLVSEYGSDPVIVDLLGLKSSQSDGIVNPFTTPGVQISDDSRIKALAEAFLAKKAA